MSDDSRDGSRPADSVDARQAALVAGGILALVVAAFVAPAAVVPGSDDGTGVDRQPSGASGDDGIVPFSLRDLLLDLSDTEGDDSDGDTRCVVALDSDPAPGGEVTVRVAYDSAPLADAPVWFDDDFVGRTDADGEVTAEVPYVRTLDVRVGVEDRPDCQGEAEARGRRAARAAPVPPASVGGGYAAADAGSTLSAGGTGAHAGSRVGTAVGSAEATPPDAADSNATVTYDIDAELSFRLLDDPYPGETVTLEARLGGDPLSDATVAVDGTTVDRTDDDGTAAFAVPDDGTETIRVAVTRGEFRAAETVDVLLLDVGLSGTGLAVVPGADATVAASLGGEPTADAAVSVDGERRGTTGSDGRSAVVLPTDPTAPVTVDAADQTATTSVLGYYAVPAAATVLLLAGLTGLAYWRRGTRGALKAVGAGGTLLAFVVALVVADAFYGWTGRYAVFLGFALPVAALVLIRWRPDLGTGAAATRSLLVGLAAVLGRALAVLRSPRSSIRGLLHSLREHLLAGALRAAGTVGSLYDAARRHAAVVAAAVALLVRFSRREDGDPAAAPEAPGNAGAGGPADQDTTTAGELAFRELWRSFARLVVHDGWRTKTPAEISRAAIDRGYPRAPVEELTKVFREVEYGGRSLSATLRGRAAEAYAALRAHEGGDDP